jgi:DNA-binding FadR family transcriptional regulator
MSLVEVRHGAGTFVIAESAALMSSAMNAVIELEDIDLPSIIGVSEAIYTKAVELGIDEATDEELVSLRAIAERFTHKMDNDEFVASLREFLMSLVAISHNRLLIIVAGFLIEAQIARADEVAASAPSAWTKIAGQLVKERIAVADALAARDNDTAREAIRQYMRRGDQLVRRHAGAK